MDGAKFEAAQLKAQRLAGRRRVLREDLDGRYAQQYESMSFTPWGYTRFMRENRAAQAEYSSRAEALIRDIHALRSAQNTEQRTASLAELAFFRNKYLSLAREEHTLWASACKRSDSSDLASEQHQHSSVLRESRDESRGRGFPESERASGGAREQQPQTQRQAHAPHTEQPQPAAQQQAQQQKLQGKASVLEDSQSSLEEEVVDRQAADVLQKAMDLRERLRRGRDHEFSPAAPRPRVEQEKRISSLASQQVAPGYSPPPLEKKLPAPDSHQQDADSSVSSLTLSEGSEPAEHQGAMDRLQGPAQSDSSASSPIAESHRAQERDKLSGEEENGSFGPEIEQGREERGANEASEDETQENEEEEEEEEEEGKAQEEEEEDEEDRLSEVSDVPEIPELGVSAASRRGTPEAEPEQTPSKRIQFLEFYTPATASFNASSLSRPSTAGSARTRSPMSPIPYGSGNAQSSVNNTGPLDDEDEFAF